VAIVSLASLIGTLWLDASLTSRVPLLGSALRRWNDLSNIAPFDRPLPAAIIMQLVLFAGLIGCLVAVLPARQRSVG
jgi:hypothetical protein